MSLQLLAISADAAARFDHWLDPWPAIAIEWDVPLRALIARTGDCGYVRILRSGKGGHNFPSGSAIFDNDPWTSPDDFTVLAVYGTTDGTPVPRPTAVSA